MPGSCCGVWYYFLLDVLWSSKTIIFLKRRGWDSNPSTPLGETGLEPAAFGLRGNFVSRWISPLCHPGTMCLA